MITPRLLTLQDMFADRVQYQVPIYQRPYAWGREEQWQPLWDDIEAIASRQIEGNGHAPQAHFLGAIVIELASAEAGRVRTYSVIDGQQRLTTLQLVLAALRTTAETRDPSRLPDIDRLLRNDGRHAGGELKYKVALGRHDRPTFNAVVDGVRDDAAVEGIMGAVTFFTAVISNWVDRGTTPESRLDALQDVLEGLLQIVAIQLDGSSDAQVIFETLNSRGADLTSLDLTKNSLLQQARREGADELVLHEEQWEPALGDADYWLETVRQGRYTRERADLFLMHWVTMRTGKVANAQRLFDDFRKNVLRAEPQPLASEIITALAADATTYRSFENFDPVTVEGRFFKRLGQMDTTTLLPVALRLFSATELIAERRELALQALESWLVRRMVLGATTQHYNRLLASLLTMLNRQNDLSHADSLVIGALRGFVNPTDRWPTDEVVFARLTEQPLYGYINPRRIRLLFEACEDRIADNNKTERIAMPDGLTVEHALPQEWQTNWRLPVGPDIEEQSAIRESHVHRLGNLTLVTQALNSALSNAEWAVKRVELAKRSRLLVNQRLCAHETWDEALIDSRSEEFARYIIETWPGPTANVWGPVTPDVVLASSTDDEATEETDDGGIPSVNGQTRGAQASDESREVIRRLIREGMSPDQIYTQMGKQDRYWVAAIEEEAREANQLAAHSPTPEVVAALRDQGLRWERIAARTFGDARRVKDVRRLYEELRGQGSSHSSYSGRGRRFPSMTGE